MEYRGRQLGTALNYVAGRAREAGHRNNKRSWRIQQTTGWPDIIMAATGLQTLLCTFAGFPTCKGWLSEKQQKD